ncbi:MAG: peptidoglycan DD-metalloendopeptidase family protein, partial [Gemmobacter sp.]|nr:peptidoglycan DD-metalloendopeptidase family protein [Gemmobacter sp.]
RRLQSGAVATLERGLLAAQQARTLLSQAIAARGTLPARLTEDAEALQQLIDNADTLDAIASALKPLSDGDEALRDFAGAQGSLALPVQGNVLRRAGEPDAAGIARPGLVIVTRPQALVSAPWSGTIRYLGPFLDYGNVMILEPGEDYLLVLAGLGTVYGAVGEVVAQGAALGLMGGADLSPSDAVVFVNDTRKGTGAVGSETLYMELRKGGAPIDPGDWFADTKE